MFLQVGFLYHVRQSLVEISTFSPENRFFFFLTKIRRLRSSDASTDFTFQFSTNHCLSFCHVTAAVFFCFRLLDILLKSKKGLGRSFRLRGEWNFRFIRTKSYFFVKDAHVHFPLLAIKKINSISKTTELTLYEYVIYSETFFTQVLQFEAEISVMKYS